MKKFIFKMGLLLAFVILIDVFWGMAFSFLQKNAKGGSTQNNYYILNECNADVIILGSSRASHHYVPQIITDSTGMSCYNCGEEGNGIILAYARYKMLTQRYTPKVVIYEITPEYDLKIDDDNSKYLRYLKPYYGEKPIKDVVDKFTDRRTQLELKSNMYRNNSAIIANTLDNVIDRGSHNGYDPLFGHVATNHIISEHASEAFQLDTAKYKLLENLIIDTEDKGIILLFAMSPSLSHRDSQSYKPAVMLSKKYNIPFLNYLDYKLIVDDVSNFQDDEHMNDMGAKLYSSIIINEIRKFNK